MFPRSRFPQDVQPLRYSQVSNSIRADDHGRKPPQLLSKSTRSQGVSFFFRDVYTKKLIYSAARVPTIIVARVQHGVKKLASTQSQAAIQRFPSFDLFSVHKLLRPWNVMARLQENLPLTSLPGLEILAVIVETDWSDSVPAGGSDRVSVKTSRRAGDLICRMKLMMVQQEVVNKDIFYDLWVWQETAKEWAWLKRGDVVHFKST